MRKKTCVIFTSILLISCQPWQVLPGLCYTDKTGTYTCPEKIDPKPKPTLPQQHNPGVLDCDKYGLIEYCEGRNQKDLKCSCENIRVYSQIIP